MALAFSRPPARVYTWRYLSQSDRGFMRHQRSKRTRAPWRPVGHYRVRWGRSQQGLRGQGMSVLDSGERRAQRDPDHTRQPRPAPVLGRRVRSRRLSLSQSEAESCSVGDGEIAKVGGAVWSCPWGAACPCWASAALGRGTRPTTLGLNRLRLRPRSPDTLTHNRSECGGAEFSVVRSGPVT